MVAKQQFKQEPAPAPLIVAELTGGVEVIEHLAAEWRALCATGNYAPPFFQPEWIAAYLQAFAADQTLVVFTARRAGRLCVVLPLVAEFTTLHGVPVRKLRSPSNVYSCRFDLMAGDGDEEEAVTAIWQALRQRRGWDVIELCDVPNSGLAGRLLTAAAHEGFPTGQWHTPAGPYLLLADDGGTNEERLEAAQQNVSAKLRASLRRLRRRLEEKGNVQLVCDEQAAPAELARFYALESAGWKGRQGTAIACDQRVRQFYDAVACAAAQQGRFLLYRLDCGAQTIAMQFCVTDGKTCYLLKPAYDETLSKYSPGHLLVSEVLRDVIERGLVAYDLLPPELEWKSYWTKTAQAQAHCYIFRRGVIGQALHAWKFQVALRARQIKQKYKADSTEGTA